MQDFQGEATADNAPSHGLAQGNSVKRQKILPRAANRHGHLAHDLLF
jgi:hypothetical protein